MLRSFVLILIGWGLFGCANHQDFLIEKTSRFTGTLGQYRQGPLPVQSWVPAGQRKHMRVFIEGDGRAFVTATRPSLDPTPSDSVILRLALRGDAAYLARPCQYVTGEQCSPIEWTDRRFSSEALVSMSGALDQIKAIGKTDSFELVGYSGGGAMALLLAASRDDVTAVQTIAGNVAPTFWAKSNGFAPLVGSLDPIVFAERLALIPQRHFVGTADKVITADVSAYYIRHLPSARCTEIRIYVGDHWAGFEESIEVGDKPMECLR